jgi:hypothetical protein
MSYRAIVVEVHIELLVNQGDNVRLVQMEKDVGGE